MLSRKYWLSDISFARPKDDSLGMYLVFLLSLSMAAGAIDVFSVPALGVFVANNTGNIVFLAMAAGQVSDPIVHPVAAITSLLAAWLGTFYSGQVGHRVGRGRRWYVFFNLALGTCLVFLCAGLIYGHKIRFHDERTEYVAIALLSFTMGSQNVTANGTGPPKTITTLVATLAMADFFSDKNLFARHNRPKDERFAFMAVFFIGGLIAAYAYRYSNPALALILCGVLKLIAVGIVLIAPAVEEPKEAKQQESEKGVISSW